MLKTEGYARGDVGYLMRFSLAPIQSCLNTWLNLKTLMLGSPLSSDARSFCASAVSRNQRQHYVLPTTDYELSEPQQQLPPLQSTRCVVEQQDVVSQSTTNLIYSYELGGGARAITGFGPEGVHPGPIGVEHGQFLFAEGMNGGHSVLIVTGQVHHQQAHPQVRSLVIDVVFRFRSEVQANLQFFSFASDCQLIGQVVVVGVFQQLEISIKGVIHAQV